jgi:hypothetical protein
VILDEAPPLTELLPPVPVVIADPPAAPLSPPPALVGPPGELVQDVATPRLAMSRVTDLELFMEKPRAMQNLETKSRQATGAARKK